MLDVPEQDVVNMNRRLTAPNHGLHVAVRMGSHDELQGSLVDEPASQGCASGRGRSKCAPSKSCRRGRLAMRRFIKAAALALGLVTLLAAIMPLAAKAASIAPSPAMSRALFLCRTRHGIDETCAAALANALINEQSKYDATAVAAGAERACHLDPQVVRRLAIGSEADQINQRRAGAPHGWARSR
jgi:hypothetical protein